MSVEIATTAERTWCWKWPEPKILFVWHGSAPAPNAIVTIVALYDRPQIFPLPDMYGKNLTFKTGGVDGCDCAEILRLIEEGKIDTTPLITHRFPLNEIEEAYRIFENKLEGVGKIIINWVIIKY